jgi:hypothetical protein
MSLFTDTLIRYANHEVGVHETGGNNCGPRIREYQAKTSEPPGAWPWCAAFICFVFWETLQCPEVIEELGLSADQTEHWRPKTALAYGFEDWAKEKHILVLPETAIAKPGDIVTYDFSHVGLVVDNQQPGVSIRTIEGNTNKAGSREGDGVYNKFRDQHLVRRFIRVQN